MRMLALVVLTVAQGYQVGVTLENTEKPKCAVDEPCLAIIARLDPAERPLDVRACAERVPRLD